VNSPCAFVLAESSEDINNILSAGASAK